MYLGVAPLRRIGRPKTAWQTGIPIKTPTQPAPSAALPRILTAATSRIVAAAPAIQAAVATQPRKFAGAIRVLTQKKQLTTPVIRIKRAVAPLKTTITSAHQRTGFRFMRHEPTPTAVKAIIPVDSSPFVSPTVNQPQPITMVTASPTAYAGSDVPSAGPSMADVAANMVNTVALKSGASIPLESDPASSGQSVTPSKGLSPGAMIALAVAGYFLLKAMK
jgi:hypothetical protein